MLQYLNQKRGQSTLEYAVLIVVIIGALLSLQVYLKRGIQGHLKQNSDDIGDQYSDGNTNVVKLVETHSNTQESSLAGTSSLNMLSPEQTNTTVNSLVDNTEYEYWGTK